MAAARKHDHVRLETLRVFDGDERIAVADDGQCPLTEGAVRGGGVGPVANRLEPGHELRQGAVERELAGTRDDLRVAVVGEEGRAHRLPDALGAALTCDRECLRTLCVRSGVSASGREPTSSSPASRSGARRAAASAA